MDVGSFERLLDKVRPHLSPKDEGMANRSRKAGAVSDEVTLAITLRYLAGSMVEDLYLVYAPISRGRVYTCLWGGINAINRAFVIDNPYGDTENACNEGGLSRSHWRSPLGAGRLPLRLPLLSFVHAGHCRSCVRAGSL